MNFNCSDALKRMHAQYVRDIQDGKLTYHYVTSACEYNASMTCGASGSWRSVHYHKAFKDAVQNKLHSNIGDTHGMSSAGNPLTVGVCAEQHVANNLLKELVPEEDSEFDVSQLVFSPAIRIKGKQMEAGVLSPCANCTTLFS